MGRQAGIEVDGDHALGQGCDVPSAGHGVRGCARVPARAAVAGALDRGHRRGSNCVLREAGATVERTLTPVAMLCRISEFYPTAVRELADALQVDARFIGSPEEPRKQHWQAALEDGRGCLLEAGGQVDDALAGGNFPLLIAGDCAIGLTTLAAVARHRPDARVLWLDTHGDFHTPQTTQSDFLRGVALGGGGRPLGAGGGGPVPPPPPRLPGGAAAEGA